jgi:hypothetical protein
MGPFAFASGEKLPINWIIFFVAQVGNGKFSAKGNKNIS